MSYDWLPLKTKLLDDGGIDEIFSHLRNLLMATVILAAGLYALRRPDGIELFSVLSLQIAGYCVGAIGICLVGLNLLDGWYKLTKLGSSMLLRTAFAGLYLFVSMRLVQFVVLLRAG